MLAKIISLLLGFFLLIKGADILLKGARKFSEITKVPELIVGVVLVGIGTSLPEIILTIKSSLTGNTDFILGNAVGSSICNLLLVLGIACVTKPIKLNLKMCEQHLVILAVSIVSLVFLSNYMFDIGYLDKKEGFILLAATIFYIAFNVRNAITDKNNEDDNKINDIQNKIKTTKVDVVFILFSIIIGVLMLNYGADFVIDSSIYIAESFNVTAEIISLTIMAAGTALPEIITSIIGSKNHNSDLVIGNIIGSNVFNTIMLPALGAIIAPIKVGIDLNNSLLFLGILTTGMIIKYVGFGNNLITKKKGITFIIVYCIYVTTLVV